MVVYNNKLVNPKDNNFNKIAETFKGNDDSNIMPENKINIPDKISIIDATKSNLTNFQISNNQMLLFQDNSQNNKINTNKTIKLHDYIRQEEKDGGVIGKDYDFKENDYFKINTPLYNSDFQDNTENVQKNDLQENNNKPNINSLNLVNDEIKSMKDLNIDNNTPNKTSNEYKSNEKMNISLNNNNKLNYKTEEIFLGKNVKKSKSANPEIEINNINNLNYLKKNINFSVNNNKNIKDKNKNVISNSQNYMQKYEPFFIKHATINLNNTENFLKNFNKEKPTFEQDNNSYLISSEKKNYSFNYDKIHEPKNLFNNKSPKTYNYNNNYMNGPIELNKVKRDKNMNYISNSHNSMNLIGLARNDNKFNNFAKINNNKIVKNNTQSKYRNTNNRNVNRNNNIIKFPISIRNKNDINYDISSEFQNYNSPSMMDKNVKYIYNNQMDLNSLKNKNYKNNIIINNVIIKNDCNIINKNNANKTEIDNKNQISNNIKPDHTSNRIIMKNSNNLNETEPFYFKK